MSKKNTTPIVVKNAKLDILGDDIVIRGYLEGPSIPLLKIDEYQREARSEGKLMEMVAALVAGRRLPDVELSLRTAEYKEVGKDTFHIFDDVFVVDGQQRTGAAVIACKENIGLVVHFGVLIHVGKTYEWEKEQFEVLNLKRDAVKKSVLLRNRKEKHPAIAALFGLTKNERTFPLYNRVTWNQDGKQGDLLNSWSLARYTCMLHSHKVPIAGGSFEDIVSALDRCCDEFGMQTVRANVRTLFEVVDEVWDIRDITYKAGAIHMRKNALQMLVRVIANHHDFWSQPDERTLEIDDDMRSRFGRFKFSEQYVRDVLTKEASRSQELATLFTEAVNKARRKKLRPRKVEHLPLRDEEEDEAA